MKAPAHCKGCIYRKSMSGLGQMSVSACHYMLRTGNPRNSDPKKCDKKTTKEKKE